MYINGILLGVLATLFVEMAMTIIAMCGFISKKVGNKKPAHFKTTTKNY
jgi:hypothetical protein